MCTLNELVKEQITGLVNNGDILAAWRQAQEVLETVKTYEMELRKKLVQETFKESVAGKNKADVDGGELIFTKKFNTTVDETLFDKVAAEAEIIGVDVGSLIKVKHSLDNKKYKMLTDEQRSIVDQTLVTKEAAPTLEFKAKVVD
jgi:hypothetical protein